MYTIITVGILFLGFYLISKVKNSFSIEGEQSANPSVSDTENTTEFGDSFSQETLDDDTDFDYIEDSSTYAEGPLSMRRQKMEPTFRTAENTPQKKNHAIQKPNMNNEPQYIHREHADRSLTLNSRKKLREAIIWREILDNKFINH